MKWKRYLLGQASDPEKYLRELTSELERAAANHYDAARGCNVMLAIFGWGSIILPTFIASTFFKEQVNTHLMATLGLASAILGAAYKSRQKELNDKAKDFKASGAEFLALLDQAKQFYGLTTKPIPTDESINLLIQKKAEVTREAPSLPFLIYYPPRFLRIFSVYAVLIFFIWLAIHYHADLYNLFISDKS